MRDIPSGVSALVGREIQRVREGQGVSQYELGLLMADRGFRWDRDVVSRVERGLRRVTVDELACLMVLLEIPAHEIFPRLG